MGNSNMYSIINNFDDFMKVIFHKETRSIKIREIVKSFLQRKWKKAEPYIKTVETMDQQLKEKEEKKEIYQIITNRSFLEQYEWNDKKIRKILGPKKYSEYLKTKYIAKSISTPPIITIERPGEEIKAPTVVSEPIVVPIPTVIEEEPKEIEIEIPEEMKRPEPEDIVIEIPEEMKRPDPAEIVIEIPEEMKSPDPAEIVIEIPEEIIATPPKTMEEMYEDIYKKLSSELKGYKAREKERLSEIETITNENEWLKKEIVTKDATIGALRPKINELTEINYLLKEQVTLLENQVAKQEDENKILRTQLEEQKESIEELKQKLQEFSNILQKHDEVLKTKDEEIDTLRKKEMAAVEKARAHYENMERILTEDQISKTR